MQGDPLEMTGQEAFPESCGPIARLSCPGCAEAAAPFLPGGEHSERLCLLFLCLQILDEVVRPPIHEQSRREFGDYMEVLP